MRQAVKFHIFRKCMKKEERDEKDEKDAKGDADSPVEAKVGFVNDSPVYHTCARVQARCAHTQSWHA